MSKWEIPTVEEIGIEEYTRLRMEEHRIKRIERKRKLKLELVEKDGQQCYYCEKSLPLHELTLDHIYPVSLYSKDKRPAYSYGAFVLACKKCNSKKGNRIISIEEFKKEIMGDKYHDPNEEQRLKREAKRQHKIEIRKQKLLEAQSRPPKPPKNIFAKDIKKIVYPDNPLIWSAGSPEPPPFKIHEPKLTLFQRIKKVILSVTKVIHNFLNQPLD